MGFEVIVADWIKIAKTFPDRISSTRIRELVMDGRMKEAQKMLGRNYQIRGIVVTGRDRGGKLLGIPTANINLHDELCPKTGIYAVIVECHGVQHNGVVTAPHLKSTSLPLRYTSLISMMTFTTKKFA
jgi:riboflavin kinase/FMN adenylyltransferase